MCDIKVPKSHFLAHIIIVEKLEKTLIGIPILSWFRPLVKSAYQTINFLISQPKHLLWVLKRTISMRRFF